MKRYIVTILAAAAVLAGCARSEMPGETSDGKTLQGLKARATLGEGVKSHFGADGYKLVWDSNDQLYAFSMPLGTMEEFGALAAYYAGILGDESEDPEGDGEVLAGFNLIRSRTTDGTMRSGVFNITPTGSGKSSATFVSEHEAAWWFGLDRENSDEDLYYFVSFYPAPATDPTLKFFNFEEVATQHPVISQAPFPYFDVTIPATQNGVDYQDYQLLYNCDDLLCAKGDLLNMDDELEFKNFAPLTSILEFTINTTDDVNAEIARLEITLSTQEEAGDYYVSDRYGIAGTVPFFFTWDRASELRIWNRNHKPFMAGFGSDFLQCPIYADSWADNAGYSPNSTLTIDFDTPVLVRKNQKTRKYYAVVIPSRCAHVDGCGNPKLTFDAYNDDGEKIFTQTKELLSSQGIEEGMKYSFDLTLDTYYAPDVLSGLFSVAADKQVYIASGNLQAYLTPGGEARDWRIAPHQYDIVGASSYDLGSYEGWFDLFSFSSEHNNFGISTSINDDDHLGEARGWTDAYPVAQGRGWRTITDAEGLYLFASRNNAEGLLSFATVVFGSSNTEVKGLLFLPDNWTLPANCTFNGWNVGSTYDYSKNIYYAEDAPAGDGVHNKWEDMQAAGAVFWPAAGMRQGTDVDLTVGAYWSGTPNNSRPAYGNMLFFCDAVEGVREGSFIPSHYLRSNGACVRLIKEFN